MISDSALINSSQSVTLLDFSIFLSNLFSMAFPLSYCIFNKIAPLIHSNLSIKFASFLTAFLSIPSKQSSAS